MPKAVRSGKRPSMAMGGSAVSAEVRVLIAALGGDDSVLRGSARDSLVAIGKPAVRSLIEALEDGNEHLRWGAAKALAEIRDKTAAAALVVALEDESFGVRWLAAEGLIALGRHTLPPLLGALVERANSIWLREGALHILRELAKQGLRDEARLVVAALEGQAQTTEVPLAAKDAIGALRVARQRRRRREAAAK